MQLSVGQRSYASWIVPGLLLTLCSHNAFAAGFAIRGQSASSIGTAGASDVSGTTDISAMFSNPAALSAFKGTNIAVGAAFIMPKGEFSEGKRTVASTGVEAINDSEDAKKSDDFGDNATIPAIYASYEVNEDVTAGVALTAPFGTNTDYGKDWVGRYHGTKTELEVINLDLAASYKLMENLKLGFGVQVQSARGLIEGASNYGAAANASVATTAAQTAAGLVRDYYNAVGAGDSAAAAAANTAIEANQLAKDFRTATQSALAGQPTSSYPTIIQNTLTSAGAQYVGGQVVAREGQDDVYASYEGNDIAYGFTFGVLYSPIAELDLGLSYRSQVVHKTEGDFKLSGETSAAEAYAASVGLKRKADLNLAVPDIIGFGANYKGVTDMNIYLSASMTRWTKIKDINVVPESGANVLVRLDWEDVWHVGLGGDYKVNENVILRAGVASDNSPTTDDLRSPRSPDDNRRMYSIGGRYQAEGWSADLGFMHTRLRDPTLNLKNDAYPEANGRGDLTGKYKVTANTLMAQYNRAL
ncbi:MAG TPA: outer membrane protein transport protein [Oligoflexus sp.]|uniref:OmpP1/FadL family transporter n=1 Tax=Oligoflexus sp. TaxID=1971216 RepID=UPI002D80B28E|nr:outer membrane protein transport protein [Oligoflexus sp.]HET9235767.1 outer membrane protein transport protein [Oligoflexus sp.]